MTTVDFPLDELLINVQFVRLFHIFTALFNLCLQAFLDVYENERCLGHLPLLLRLAHPEALNAYFSLASLESVQLER